MQTITSSKYIIPALRARACVVMITCAFLLGIVMVFSVLWATILILLAAVLFLAAWLFYIPAFAKSMMINLSDTSISVSRGVFLKKKYVIPNARQVYAQRYRTPIDSLFQLTNVTIRLTRGSVTIFGLTKADADTVMQRVCEVSRHQQ